VKKILLLGHTGKLGGALEKVLAADYQLIGKNSSDFDAADFGQVAETVRRELPDLIINAIAFQGVDRREAEPEAAFRINTLLPGQLADLAADLGKALVHFSTEAVFSDRQAGNYCEHDIPAPLNLYGLSKLGGELLVRSRCERHYILRLPILFGESQKKDQFVEKMLARIESGAAVLHVADDIISSPTYTRDVAVHLRGMIATGAVFGTYHITNEGSASLFDLIAEIVVVLGGDVTLARASYRDFPYVGIKNRYTPLSSVKGAVLRPWQEAVHDYCARLKGD